MHDAAGAGKHRTAQAILAYLARHPRAADTEHGIAQWWLPEMGVEAPLAQVQQALQALVQRGEMERVVLPDGGAIYRAPTP